MWRKAKFQIQILKVFYRNMMKGKSSHLNEVKCQIFLQMRLKEYFAEVEGRFWFPT